MIPRLLASLLALPLAAAGCSDKKAPAGPPDVGESVPPDEPAAIEATAKIVAGTVRQQFADAGPPARRDAHAKAHGCVKARVTVPELPPDLRVGVFQKPRTYFAWVRYSNGNGTPQPDSVGDGRGMAVKLMGVPGKKILPGEADQETVDFLMINHPVFFVDTAANYVTFERDLAGGDPLAYFLGLENPLSWHLEALEIVKAITGHKMVDPLDGQYYSMSAYLFGDRAVKVSAKSCGTPRTDLAATASPTFLADNMEKHLQTGAGCFDLMVQLQTNPRDMPVESPMKLWREDASPFRTVARIDIPPQSFRSEEQVRFCENLTFTPWHALPEHRPLGGLNRLRRVVYETISKTRHELNGVRPAEPTAGPDFLPVKMGGDPPNPPAQPAAR